MIDVQEQTSIPLSLLGPSEKERKYDRQLRLWATDGQSALESAHVLLVNSGSGAVGIECLKNLILPGLGRFTIFDEAVVAEPDLGVNFFLSHDSIQSPRAQCCTNLLLELNPEVHGVWYRETPTGENFADFLENLPRVTVIVYTSPIVSAREAAVHQYGQRHVMPVVAVHSVGLYSYFKITMPCSFPIVQTHPEPAATLDLRLTAPWPELSACAAELTRDLDTLDEHENGHLPYIVVLLHYLQIWKDTHRGELPSRPREINAFHAMIQRSMRPETSDGGRENIEQALAIVRRVLLSQDLPSSVRHVFEHVPMKPEAAPGFWIITQAVRSFYQDYNCLPVSGSIPDMKAKPDVYIRLQNIYKEKARRDAADVLNRVRALPWGVNVDAADVEMFCKNASYVRVLAASKHRDIGLLRETAARLLAEDVIAETNKEPGSLMPVYLALLATSHIPQANGMDVLEEIERLVPGASHHDSVVRAAEEVARADGGELHSMSTITGGMIAQEVIKIITRQYIPVDNTCIFDGISSRCQVLRL